MARRIYVARPRLDCSFKKGAVPAMPGLPRNDILRRFGEFIDGMVNYHLNLGDSVQVETRALWQFELEEVKNIAASYDRVYFPHKLRRQFPIGDNALYYKNSPLHGYFTADPMGWGASLSFLPPVAPTIAASISISELREPLALNKSIFEQPPATGRPLAGPYILFLCQLPHDETILFHSNVSVQEALSATVRYAEQRGLTLLVKGHPANPRSMEPLKSIALASPAAVWTDTVSIHSALQHAQRVFLVNSGSGMEALLHDKAVIRFGRAEYDSVTPLATPDLKSLIALEQYKHSSADYERFLINFAQNCIRPEVEASYASVLDR